MLKIGGMGTWVFQEKIDPLIEIKRDRVSDSGE